MCLKYTAAHLSALEFCSFVGIYLKVMSVYMDLTVRCFVCQVRVATEGINGTVGGTILATDVYIKTMRSHALFNTMEEEDFKVR